MLREDDKSSKIRDYSWISLKDRLQRISKKRRLRGYSLRSFKRMATKNNYSIMLREVTKRLDIIHREVLKEW